MTSHWMKQHTLLELSFSSLKVRSERLPFASVTHDKKSLLPAFRIRKDGGLTQVVLYPNVASLRLPYNGTHVAVGYNGRFAPQRLSYRTDKILDTEKWGYEKIRYGKKKVLGGGYLFIYLFGKYVLMRTFPVVNQKITTDGHPD